MHRSLYICTLIACLCTHLHAQSPIGVFTAGYVSGTTTVNSYSATPAPGSSSFNACASTNYTYTFNNGTSNNLRLTGIVTNSRNYFISSSNGTVKLRRVNNSNVTGNRSIVFLESTTSPTNSCPGGSFNFKSPYNDNLEEFLTLNCINQGTDNLFTNAGNGDGNMNNIERVDVIFEEGLATSSPEDAGFAILDRGNNNGHDGFRIAAILSLDANGNPDAFGAVRTCVGGNGSNNGDWGHPSTANGNLTIAGYVLRKEQGESRVRVSTALNQQLGGVFFSFADLGIDPYQEIFGYALLGPDGIANPTSAQLLDINDAAVYPTNTTEPSGGGLDLIALTATFASGPLVSAIRTELTSSIVNNDRVITWSADNLQPLSTVELQASRDGAGFTTVYSEVVLHQSAQGRYVQYGDDSYFYRLKVIFPDGRIRFSQVLRIPPNGRQPSRIYPSLVTSHQQLIVEGLNDGTYKAEFISLDGRVKTIDLLMTNGKGIITVPGNLQRGVYYVSLVNGDGQRLKGGRVVIQ